MNNTLWISERNVHFKDYAPKRVQKATNLSESSGILYYQSRQEQEKLIADLYPRGIQYRYRHQEYYEYFRRLIR